MSLLSTIIERIRNYIHSTMTKAEVEAELTRLAAGNPDKLKWRTTIVDLLKLLDMDSSLKARKVLATELGYTGALDGSAEMNTWLHKEVVRALGSNQIPFPD